ncbi:NADP-dependent oxidoreductase [Rhodococcus sp. 06-462-5]|uniref:MDR family NADP-dependent oxidoreductase n=1 Tax=unclassified Rhodococcus (in: high G+C Gram-positive bacteria) TaxID=192944 RepID=UPI000B9AA8DE|nr:MULTISPECIES: NADP-dependent oxidoreductase [unclassified Rhodococcus (in: high G+C Gram-positive bacteria)]OZC75255.1 NADP-dependent oxidoreductase [Rhodococcus sp. 06-462-5]OZE67774.1 NADP-dependent oxidoreductase [Rhodococcus sp. 02-925g]
MNSTETTAVVLRSHRTDVGQQPSELLEVRVVDQRPIGDGEVLVENIFLQIVAVHADLMFENPGLPLSAFEVGAPLYGPAVGRVVESRSEIALGTVVQHNQGWRDLTAIASNAVFPVPDGVFPGPEYMLNQGVTSFHGMVDIAGVGAGDVVLVSGAAGGVGSIAGQIAKAQGAALVIGIAGGPDKCAYLTEQLGFDAAIDYKNEDLDARLGELAPKGITVFFDTIGGTQFETAVRHAAFGARFALCGALAGQIGGGDGGHPRLDIMTAIVKEVQIRPFTTMHNPEQIQAWIGHYIPSFSQGTITFPHTVLEGPLSRTMTALDELLAGDHRGNLIVKLAS